MRQHGHEHVVVDFALTEGVLFAGQASLELLESAHLAALEHTALQLLGAVGPHAEPVDVGHTVLLRVVQAGVGEQVEGDELEVGLGRRLLGLADAQERLAHLLARVRWHVAVQVEDLVRIVESVTHALDHLHRVAFARVAHSQVAFAPNRLRVLLVRDDLDVPLLENNHFNYLKMAFLNHFRSCTYAYFDQLVDDLMRLTVEAHQVNAVRSELTLEVSERLEQEAQPVVATICQAFWLMF